MSKLLIVDDDLAVLEVLEELLEILGHEVISANNGRIALELLEEQQFHLVLTDLRMPDVEGWEIARQAKAKDPELPVILLSGWVPQSEVLNHHLTERCIDIFLPKPIDSEELFKSVGKLLRK